MQSDMACGLELLYLFTLDIMGRASPAAKVNCSAASKWSIFVIRSPTLFYDPLTLETPHAISSPQIFASMAHEGVKCTKQRVPAWLKLLCLLCVLVLDGACCYLCIYFRFAP